MRNHERDYARDVAGQVEEFLSSPVTDTFYLSGGGGEWFDPDFAVCIYSNGIPVEDEIANLSYSGTNVDSFEAYKRIAKVEIPQEVDDLGIIDDNEKAFINEKITEREGMPSIVLMVGRAVRTGEDSIVLGMVNGISPKSALSRVKNKVSSRRRTFN